MSITFVTPEDVTPGTKLSWQDVDTSTVPDGASGVLVEFVNTDTSNTDLTFGIRKNGSADSRETDVHEESHQWAFCGVDGSGIFEVYVETGVSCYLIAYFGDEATFFTDAVDKSFDSPTTTWTDVDISSDTGDDTAIAALIEFNTGANDDVGVRKNGSTDDRGAKLVRRKGYAIVGVDGSEIFEAYISAATCDIFLMGYLTADVTMHTNATDRTSEVSVGSYSDLTALPAGAIGGIYNIYDSGDDAADEHYDIRANGSSRTSQWCTQFEYALAISECDGSRVVEAILTGAGTPATIFEIGYFTGETALAISVSEAITGGEAVTVAVIRATSVSDTVSIGEAISASLPDALGLSVTDAVSIAETIGYNLISFAPVSEAVSTAESTSVSLPDDLAASVSDSVTVAEIIDIDIITQVDISEAASAAETIAASLPDALAIDSSETVTIAESITFYVEINLSVIEAISTGESVAVDIIFVPMVSDAVAVAETVAAQLPDDLMASISDSITVAEIASVNIIVEISAAEAVSLGESITAQISEAMISISESVTVAEIVTVNFICEIAAGDSVSVVESVTTAALALNIIASETSSLAEALGVAITSAQVQASESVTVAEIASIIEPDALICDITELISLAEIINPNLVSLPAVIDAVTGGDAVNLTALAILVTVTEAVSGADVVGEVDTGQLEMKWANVATVNFRDKRRFVRGRR